MERIKHILRFLSEVLIAIFTFLLSIILWVFKPDGNVKTWLFVLVAGILFIICIISIKWGLVQNKKTLKSPTLINILNDTWIFSPSELFAQQTYVSIYKKLSGAEILIAVGIIEIITDTGNIQINGIKQLGNESADWLLRNRDTIILKPNINRFTLEQLMMEE